MSNQDFGFPINEKEQQHKDFNPCMSININEIDFSDIKCENIYANYHLLVHFFIDFYKNNNYSHMKEILDINKNIGKKIMEIISEEKNKSLMESLRSIPPEEFSEDNNIAEELYNVKIEKIINFASCYGLFFALNDIGEKIKDFAITPELIEKLPSDVRYYLYDIFSKGYLNKKDIPYLYMSLFIQEEICFINNNRIFLTAKGVNLARMFKDINDFSLSINIKEHINLTESWKRIRSNPNILYG